MGFLETEEASAMILVHVIQETPTFSESNLHGFRQYDAIPFNFALRTLLLGDPDAVSVAMDALIQRENIDFDVLKPKLVRRWNTPRPVKDRLEVGCIVCEFWTSDWGIGTGWMTLSTKPDGTDPQFDVDNAVAKLLRELGVQA